MASHGFLPKQPPDSIRSVVYVVARRCHPLRTKLPGVCCSPLLAAAFDRRGQSLLIVVKM